MFRALAICQAFVKRPVHSCMCPCVRVLHINSGYIKLLPAVRDFFDIGFYKISLSSDLLFLLPEELI